MKVEAKELRIGNWVEFTFIGGDKSTMQVRSIDNGHANQIHQDFISGIPLNPELLEKCGFVKEDPRYGEVWLLKNSPFIVRRMNYANGFEKPDYGFALELSDARNWAAIIERVEYLHTLQNFYSLTQTELKPTI